MIPVLNIIHIPIDQLTGPLRSEATRREHNIKAHAFQHKIPYALWDGIMVKNLPHTGISRSHKQIVQHAKDMGLNLAFIAEDDFKLTSPNSWNHFIDNLPDDFDLYLGGISGGAVNEDDKTVSSWSGLFFYAISHRFYDVFLACPEEYNIDRWLSGVGLPAIEKQLGRKPVYKVCYPMAAITSDGISFKSGSHVNHDHFYKGYQKFQI